MSQFLTKLTMSPAHENKDDGLWVLDAPLVYQSDVAKQTFTVPVGFQTDLASVPRIPFVFELFGGTSNEASVIHDYLYKNKIGDRAVADDVLAEASAVTGVPSWRRGPMWAAVRLFGGTCWGS